MTDAAAARTTAAYPGAGSSAGFPSSGHFLLTPRNFCPLQRPASGQAALPASLADTMTILNATDSPDTLSGGAGDDAVSGLGGQTAVQVAMAATVERVV